MQLKDYIKGNKHGKEANRLEREAMNDPFLQGALDGFDSVAGDHAKIIEQLEEKFTRPVIAQKSKNKSLFYWAAAASILLLIGISTYFFKGIHEDITYDLAVNQNIENENLILDNPFVSKQEYLAESQPEPLIAEKEVRKVIPVPAKTAISPVTTESISNLSEDVVAVAADVDTHSVSISGFAEAEIITESSATFLAEEQDTQTIQGKIVDETGEPLIGVSVMGKGTNIGTLTRTDGTFTLNFKANDSSRLIASYIGYKPQEINPLTMNQIVTLREDTQALSEAVVVEYATQKRATLTGAVSTTQAREIIQGQFGEKEFQTWCKQNANKNVCDGKEASVKVSFFIDEKGKLSKFEFQNYSCEDAKKEMENLLLSSPTWTKINRKITITVKW